MNFHNVISDRAYGRTLSKGRGRRKGKEEEEKKVEAGREEIVDKPVTL